MAAIPTELIVEILSRLPVKSLLCFKTVCKFWNDFINTPNFIKLHLNRTLISSSDRHLLRWSEDSSLYSAKIDLDLHPNHLYFSKLKLPFPFETQKRIFVVGSCNGVVCITDYSKNDFFLYNPLTNSHRKLPTNQIPNPKFITQVICGFGYDSKNDDYKVLKICRGYSSDTVTVYSLKNNTWRSVEGIQTQIPIFFNCAKGVLVNEALHFAAYLTSKSDSNSNPNLNPNPNYVSTRMYIYIYIFDLGTESFSIMGPAIPGFEWSRFIKVKQKSRSINILRHCHLFVRELGGCLCIVADYKNVAEIWVMKEYGNIEPWTKLFCLNNPLNIIRCGYLEPIVYSNDKNGRRRCLMNMNRSRLAWYDLDTKKYTTLNSHDEQQPIYVLDFLGSLVSVN